MSVVTSKSASQQTETPPWESPQWQEAVSQNPGLAPFFDNLESFVDLPEGIEKLRGMVLQLAVQGKLVSQDSTEEPAVELIAEIAARKKELVDAKEIAKPKKLPIIDSVELPFQLPPSWEWTRLESVCEVITKGSSPKWQGVSYLDTADGGIMFVTSENVGNYVMRKMDSPKYVEAKFNEMEPRSILKREDILVNLVGASIGRSAMWDRDDVANINQAVGIVRLVPGCRSVNRRYLLDYLNSPTCLAIMLGNRVITAQPNISLTNVKHFLVPLPPLAEQRRIVSKVEGLMSLCDTLESQRRARMSVRERASRSVLVRLTSASAPLPAGTSRATSLSTASGETLKSSWQRLSDHFEVLLDQPSGPAHLRQSILQLAVQGKLVPQDSNDEPASAILEAIRASREARVESGELKRMPKTTAVDLNTVEHSIPATWAWCHVEDISTVKLGGTPARGTPEYWGGDGKWVSSGEVANCRITDTEEKITDVGLENSNAKLYPPGTVLIAMIGQGKTRGQSALLEVTASTNQNVAGLIFDSGQMDSEYVWKWALCQYESTRSGGRGGAQPALNGAKIRALRFPLPPLAEQKRIVSKVSVLLSQLDELSARLRSRQSTTDALLTALIHQILEEA